MAYPGQYGTVHRGGNSSDPTMTNSHRPLATNTTTNYIQTTSAPRSQLNVGQSGVLATSSALQTSAGPMMTSTGGLYAPQPAKAVSLKSGFTMSISDPELIATRTTLPQTLVTPEYLNEDTLFEELLAELLASSSRNETDSNAKKELLARAQQISVDIWKIGTNRSTITATCRDENVVTEQVPAQYAEFNGKLAESFQQILRKICDINISTAADSYISLTAYEVALSRLVHHYYMSHNVPSLKAAFARLTRAVGSAGSQIAPQTLDVLRGLIYFIGLALLRTEQRQDAQVDLLASQTQDLSFSSNTDPLVSSSAQTQDSKNESLAMFFLRHLLEAQGLQWACALLHPSLDDVMLHNWLGIAFDTRHLNNLTELEMVKVVTQIPWVEFPRLAGSSNLVDDPEYSTIILPEFSSELEEGRKSKAYTSSTITPSHPQFLEIIKRTILIPIQTAVAVAASKNYVGAIVFLSKILSLVSRCLPSQLTATCVGILMRAPWPAKMVALPALQLFDWNALNRETLLLLFGELYHLFQRKPMDYFASSARESKMDHRNQFANYVISNQPMMGVTYQIDSSLYRLNYQRFYPIFFIFAQIALAWLKLSSSEGSSSTNMDGNRDLVDLPTLGETSDLASFDLPRLAVEEMFHFAACWTPLSSSPNYAYQCSALAQFRAESHDALNRICQEAPRLYDHVMLELLYDLQIPNFPIASGLAQLQPQLMTVDWKLFSSLHFLFTRRSISVLPPANSPTYRSSLSMVAEEIMGGADVAKERFTDSNAWTVATDIFSRLLWHKAPPVITAFAILLLLALKNVRGAPISAFEWTHAMLAKLFAPSVLANFSPLATDLLLEQLSQCPLDYAAALSTRTIVALNAVKNAVKNNAVKNSFTGTSSPMTSTNNPSSPLSASNAFNSTGSLSNLLVTGSPMPGASLDGAASRYTFSWLWDSFKLKSVMDHLIMALRKLPNPQVQQQLQQTMRNAPNATNRLATSTPPNTSRIYPSLVLLKRVVYYYAHCIKHSPGQGQREISVVFNQLVDQLELFQKGSGMTAIEELFNESMGPRAGAQVSNEASQLESRALFLEFWVFALVPRLPQWSTSDALSRTLDAFAYTAFFSQARFGEMVSLLPQKQVALHAGYKPQNVSAVYQFSFVELSNLLQKKLVWLVYFIIWAYAPAEDPYQLSMADVASPTPSEKFRSSQLWRWIEAATSPHVSPAVALIFWERFFWGYFEVSAQRASTEFIPARWQNMIHSFLLRSGYSLAHPGSDPALQSVIRPNDLIPADGVPILAMHHVYARLTTWNKGEIFTSGAYLFQPLLLPPDAPEAILLAELHNVAQVPSLFAVAYDPAKEDLTAQKPFPTLPLPETPDVVASLIPPPRADTSALFTNETNLNVAYLFELDRNRKALEKSVLDETANATAQTHAKTLAPPVTPGNPNEHSDFNPRLGVSGNTSLAINKNGSQLSRIPALEDLDVWSAQLLSLESDLRSCDDREVSALRTLWRVVDKHVPLIMSCGEGCEGPHRVTVKTTVVMPGEGQSEAIQRARAEYEQVRMSQLSAQRNLASSVVIIEDLARCTLDLTDYDETYKNSLLVSLLFQLLPKLLDGSIRTSSPLFTRLMAATLLLGREAIQSRATRDHMRFFKALLESKGREDPYGSSRSLITTMDPSKSVSGASPLMPLIELFTPSCFIQAEDYSVYVELLYILVHTPIFSGEGLTIEEQVALSSQFMLPKYIDRLVESHLQRLFEILDLAAVKPALIELVNLGITAILKRYAGQLSNLKMGSDFTAFTEFATPTPTPDLIDTGTPFPSADHQGSEMKQTAEIVGRIVRLVLLACPHSPMLGSWEMMNDAWLGPYLLPFVSSALPSSSAAVVGSAISLVARVTQLPNFDVNAHFDLLANFFKALFSNASEKPLLSTKNRAAFVAGYELLVSRLTANQVWQLYLNVITPFFAHNSGSDLSQPLDILCSAKWGQITLHLTDPTFVVQLSQLTLFHMPLVRTIFSSIPWLEYAKVTKENATKFTEELLISASVDGVPPPNAHSLVEPKMIHFLSLFFKMNLLAPSYIDVQLKKLVMSVSKQPTSWYNEGRHLFDWREAKPEDFPLAFRGDTLVRTLRAISVAPRSSDPSTDFLDNIQLFNDVSRYSGCVEAIEVCLEEIRAALFFATPSCAPAAPAGSLWHLPIHANIECVSNYMIPLAQQYHQMQAERCTLPMSENGAPRMIYHQSSYEALVSLLAVAGFAFANFDPENPSQFGNSAENSPQLGRSTTAFSNLGQPNINPVYRILDFPVPFFVSPGTPGGLENFRKETMKAADVIKGLIVRFMGTLDNDLCLAVLHVASRAFPSEHHHAALVVLWEEALRSFFIQSKFAEQLTIAVNAITIPDEERKLAVLRTCGEMRCPLAMRLILETERQEWLNFPRPKYSEAAASTIPFIINCRAPLHREFDLLVLWFFVLDVVCHPKFHFTMGSPQVQSSPSAHQGGHILGNVSALIEYFNRHTGENEGLILNTFNKINAFFDDNSVNKDMMKLAMRAVRLILQRELTGKEPLAHSFMSESILPKDLDGQIQQIAKLYPGKKGSEMQRYPTFFQELLPSMLSPLLEVPVFEMKLVRSLVPIAPYLQCFIDGHENWTDSGV